MYAPGYPTRAANPATAHTHIHPPDKTLSEHERDEQFRMYLAGRHLAYSEMIRTIQEKIARARRIQQTNPRDTALWTLTEGEIDGAQEILALLQQAKDKT